MERVPCSGRRGQSWQRVSDLRNITADRSPWQRHQGRPEPQHERPRHPVTKDSGIKGPPDMAIIPPSSQAGGDCISGSHGGPGTLYGLVLVDLEQHIRIELIHMAIHQMACGKILGTDG
ncbi:hypothetical protein NDU88_001585 [Pleurodeles waltl]|uniref:Uncharacterized protein n=1 Tax=Pleurodeles waltl TaxID=8319 RepID=A0AAV7UT63_PLEWA|nr:hypothetical protein NDU88_001585 [Pleurodeles waltl]